MIGLLLLLSLSGKKHHLFTWWEKVPPVYLFSSDIIFIVLKIHETIGYLHLRVLQNDIAGVIQNAYYNFLDT